MQGTASQSHRRPHLLKAIDQPRSGSPKNLSASSEPGSHTARATRLEARLREEAGLLMRTVSSPCAIRSGARDAWHAVGNSTDVARSGRINLAWRVCCEVSAKTVPLPNGSVGAAPLFFSIHDFEQNVNVGTFQGGAAMSDFFANLLDTSSFTPAGAVEIGVPRWAGCTSRRIWRFGRHTWPSPRLWLFSDPPQGRSAVSVVLVVRSILFSPAERHTSLTR